ncbi:MAG: redox-regulated ATPase YchF [Myxococcales bacterium]|nr:redox-regulated ATPase YchF [Myxococcales bacterium]
MGLKVGIVGLPNVGKSTLFNAVSTTAKAEAANFPFCTIDPNVGTAPVYDPRFDALVKLYKPAKEVRATVDFVDIAGLVRGASKGEGKGNAFLSHIREVDAIAHVVRCFDDDNVLHVDNKVDPLSDIETIETELILKDLDAVNKRLDAAKKRAKFGDANDRVMAEALEVVAAVLDRGEMAHTAKLSDDARALVRELFLLTDKPMFFVANVAERDIGAAPNRHLVAVTELAKKRNVPVVPICAAIEAEIASMPVEDRPDFLSSVGLAEPGLHQVIRTGFSILDLITFFTAGDPEVHAWPIKRGSSAPGAAGKIHTDIEKGFVKAEIIFWKDLVELGSEAACRAAGKLNIEGKAYVMRDGDVAHFRHTK